MATNPWKAAFIFVIIILLVAGSISAFSRYADEKYNEGYQAATNAARVTISNYILSELQTNGFVPFQMGNVTVRLVPVK